MKSGVLFTMGSFDGVHRGHSVLIDRAVTEARKRKLTSAALTFGLPPRMVLDRKRPVSILSTAEEKETLLRWKGLAKVVVQKFDQKFSKIKPYLFFCDLLLYRYRAAGLVVGLDFRFGVNRSAGVVELVRWGQEKRIPVWVIPPVRHQRIVVSSTEIRRLLQGGQFKRAVQLLGHPYLIHGTVAKGRGVGRRIGFPTTNLEILAGKVLPQGVFAVLGRSWAKKKGPLLTGVCNIGTRPTFLKKSDVTVEIHWLTGQPPPAKSPVMIELIAHLRREKRFSSPSMLARAIAADVKSAHKVLTPRVKNKSILRAF